jgi:hypothetical protein
MRRLKGAAKKNFHFLSWIIIISPRKHRGFPQGSLARIRRFKPSKRTLEPRERKAEPREILGEYRTILTKKAFRLSPKDLAFIYPRI